MASPGDFAALARPLHWTKNSVVLIGPLFAQTWRDAALWQAALGTMLAFCLASSAAYALNDSMDAARDRAHPGKRHRPVADGRISPRAARRFAAVLAFAALVLAGASAPGALGWIAGYLLITAAYSCGLKVVPVLEVFVVSSGFVLRLLAGTLGLGLVFPGWLLACVLLLTLFLGFAKRRAELARLGTEAGRHREVLRAYTTGFLDIAVTVTAAGTVLVYALYTLDEHTALTHGTGSLVASLPWVLLGLFRYLYRLGTRNGGGDPATEVLRDPLLALAALGWLATIVLLFA